MVKAKRLKPGRLPLTSSGGGGGGKIQEIIDFPKNRIG